jgi:hypothetical protein
VFGLSQGLAGRRLFLARFRMDAVIMSKYIALILASTALAGCCVSGNGCYLPAVGVPIAWDGLGTAPTETADAPEDRPTRKATRPKKEIIIGPIGGVAAEAKPKLEGREAYAQQEAADRADEARLTKKLMICSNCMPAPTKADASGGPVR